MKRLTPTITVGMPVYNGTKYIEGALKCLQQQTFRDFEVIISVDGNDLATAEKCRPFLDDNRFRMIVHQERLDWFGNLNWLLKQPLGEFFCYRQHDDTTTADFFERLVRTAWEKPDAAAVYADCKWMGGRTGMDIAASIEGDTLHRLRQHIEQRSLWPCGVCSVATPSGRPGSFEPMSIVGFPKYLYGWQRSCGGAVSFGFGDALLSPGP